VYHKQALKTTSKAKKKQNLHKKTPNIPFKTALRRLPIKARFAIVLSKRAPGEKAQRGGRIQQ